MQALQAPRPTPALILVAVSLGKGIYQAHISGFEAPALYLPGPRPDHGVLQGVKDLAPTPKRGWRLSGKTTIVFSRLTPIKGEGPKVLQRTDYKMGPAPSTFPRPSSQAFDGKSGLELGFPCFPAVTPNPFISKGLYQSPFPYPRHNFETKFK